MTFSLSISKEVVVPGEGHVWPFVRDRVLPTAALLGALAGCGYSMYEMGADWAAQNADSALAHQLDQGNVAFASPSPSSPGEPTQTSADTSAGLYDRARNEGADALSWALGLGGSIAVGGIAVVRLRKTARRR